MNQERTIKIVKELRDVYRRNDVISNEEAMVCLLMFTGVLQQAGVEVCVHQVRLPIPKELKSEDIN